MRPLRQPTPEDYRLAHPWPEPVVARDLPLTQGPVLVTVEYHIDPMRRAEFLAALAKLQVIRQRDGAGRWSVYEDMAEQGH